MSQPARETLVGPDQLILLQISNRSLKNERCDSSRKAREELLECFEHSWEFAGPSTMEKGP